MRVIAPIAAVALLALAAACSPGDHQGAGADVKDAGRSVANAAAGVAHNADVKRAEADLRQGGHAAAQDFRKLAAEAKIEAHKLSGDTRGATHDVTRHDHPDDRSG